MQTNTIKYNQNKPIVGTIIIHKMNLMHLPKEVVSSLQTYTLKKGLKKFQKKGYIAALGKMKQLHNQNCFCPIDPRTMTKKERLKAMETLIFLTKKRDGRVKARMCANGSIQREWMTKEDSASPTTALEPVLATSIINAKEGRDTRTVDITNAFIQTLVPQDGEERIIIKIRGTLVHFLIEIDPSTYLKFVTYKNRVKILYCNVLKAIYGMLTSTLLFYTKWRDDLLLIGYKLNPYDPWIANKIVNGKKHTVTWHIVNLKISHINPKVNDKFIKWVDKLYGDNKIGRVQAKRGKVHNYLGMVLDYNTPGKVTIDMRYYIKNMSTQYKYPSDAKYKSPASENLFKTNTKRKPLPKEDVEDFHTTVAIALFVLKRAHPDIQTTIAFICT